MHTKTNLLILTALTILFFAFLGTRPLSVPDGARYSEIAREMVQNNDYITPRLNGVKYFEKPALFYWLESASIKLFGFNLWSLRIVNALFALFGCLITYAVARKLYNRKTGITACFVLATSVLYFGMAHIVSLDITLTVFLSASLFAFLLGTEQPQGLTRRAYFGCAFAAAACAVMTKGLVGIVFPCLIAGTWIVLTHQWRLLKTMYLPFCLLIFLILALPWHILVQIKNPEFFNFYFIQQQFLRYATLSAHRYQPIWYFIPVLFIGFFPWIIFLPKAIMFTLRRAGKKELFFALWIILIFAFFSLSKSKLIPYVLPIFPPLAVLTGYYLAENFKRNSLILFFGINFLFLFILLFFLPSIDNRSIQPLTAVLKPILKPNDEVVAYRQYYQDLPVYLERRVTIVDWQNELAFGMGLEDTSAWMITDNLFWQRWNSNKRIYVVTGNSNYADMQKIHPHEKIYLISQTVRNVLITNHPFYIVPTRKIN